MLAKRSPGLTGQHRLERAERHSLLGHSTAETGRPPGELQEPQNAIAAIRRTGRHDQSNFGELADAGEP
jgi:hypothetical protein